MRGARSRDAVGDPAARMPKTATFERTLSSFENGIAELRRRPGRRLVTAASRLLPGPVRRRIRRRFPIAVERLMQPASPLLRSTRRRAVLFVSGAPEMAKRYRCDHQAEQLALLGASVTVAAHGEFNLPAAAADYRVFVLHRVPWGSDVEVFIERAHAHGGVVLFDTDDLVFEPRVIAEVAAVRDLSPRERDLYEDGLHRYRRTMQACDAVTVSTASLATAAKPLHDRVVVTPNVASVAMVESAETALRYASSRDDAQSPSGPRVTIAYMSGTNTHRVDFLEAADALLAVLGSRPETRLLVVGPLELDRRFLDLDSRLERLPLQRWARLPAAQACTDINLAPLEPDNTFTGSKSCVKWIEAALVGVPTIASPRADFTRVIRDGENGLLAEEQAEWERALTSLVDDSGRRQAVGQQARADVLRLHTTKAIAPDYRRKLRTLLPAQPRELTVNWVLHAPIPRNSGGYRNIFRIAAELGRRGHSQRLCLNPIAHLANLSREQICDFVEAEFGVPENADIVVGHGRIPSADVSIATFWTTAPIVAAHDESLFKAYFIQDFEPEFYAEGDPLYGEAARTYDLPLRHICLGAYLGGRIDALTKLAPEVVDFALDPEFRLRVDPEERGDSVKILFFARPGLRRRGYDLGLEALRSVKAAHPDVEVVSFGSSSEDLGPVPFAMRNLGVLDAEGVADAMNSAHVLLTFSLTNISNVPFEGMACGCAIVDLDLPSVSAMVSPGENCLLAEPEPDAVARAVTALVEDPALRTRLARQGAADAGSRTWERTGAMFEESLARTCFVRLEAGRAARAARRGHLT